MSQANVDAFKRSIEAYNRGDVEGLLADLDISISVIHDVGDRIVAVGNLTIRGRGSGLQTESPFGWLADFKNAKATSIRTYLNPDEALEIAGLA